MELFEGEGRAVFVRLQRLVSAPQTANQQGEFFCLHASLSGLSTTEKGQTYDWPFCEGTSNTTFQGRIKDMVGGGKQTANNYVYKKQQVLMFVVLFLLFCLLFFVLFVCLIVGLFVAH